MCVPVEGYTIFWLCVYLLKVIPSVDFVCTCWRLYHLLTLCVPVEGNTIFWLCVYLLKVIPSFDFVYLLKVIPSFDFVCTCWRLYHLLTLCVPVEGNTRHLSKLDIYVCFSFVLSMFCFSFDLSLEANHLIFRRLCLIDSVKIVMCYHYLNICCRPGFPTSYVMAFFVFCELRLELIVYFVDIGGIVDHHCLSFLFINPFA